MHCNFLPIKIFLRNANRIIGIFNFVSSASASFYSFICLGRGAYSVKRRTATPRKEKEKKNAEKENVQNFEEETRMSASEVPQTMSTKTGAILSKNVNKLDVLFHFCHFEMSISFHLI